MMYSYEKIAGLILDQQDDPGVGWDNISQYWPDELEPPNVGMDTNKTACAAELSHDGQTKIARYPVDTPSNALASSMYFLSYGMRSIDGDAHVKIATALQEARIAHQVELPQGFVDSLVEKEAAQEDIFADDAELLPVTTVDQTEQSIAMMEMYGNEWPAGDRMLLSRKLEKAAEYHGIDCDLEYSGSNGYKNMEAAIEKRAELMAQLLSNHEFNMRKEASESNPFDDYLSGLEEVLELLEADQYMEMCKAATLLETLDREHGFDEAWGKEFPSAIDSIVSTEKQASMDWEGLRGVFNDDVVDSIASDPDSVIPTLPTPERKMVEDYINERV